MVMSREGLEKGLTVGASNHHVEAGPPLSFVGGFVCDYWRSPERAFEIGDTRRIWAVRTRGNAGIPFNVDTKCLASRSLITPARLSMAEAGGSKCLNLLRGASQGVVALQGV